MKIKLRRHIGFSWKDLWMNIAMFCVVSFALLESASISVPIVSLVKTPILYLGAVCLILQTFYLAKRLKKKRYFYIFAAILLLIAMLLTAAWCNPNPKLGDPPMKDTIRLVLYLLELFLLMIWVAETENSKKLLDFVFRYMLVLTVLTDLLLFTRLITFTDGHFETYLIGTKFTVVYFHMNLMVLWYVRNRGRLRSDKKAKRIIYIGIPVAFLTAIRVDCISGVLGCLVLFVLLMILDRPIQKKLLRLSSPWVLLLAMVISVVFPFIAETILDIPAVTFVIENILGRDNKLTGRLNIFQAYGRQMRDHWLWGYGYGNGNIASVTLFGYENAQNALLHWALQIGIPTTVCMALVMLMIFRQHSKTPDKSRCMPFVALIYMYLVLGMIETTFSMSFFLWLAVIFMLSNERRQPVLHTTE